MVSRRCVMMTYVGARPYKGSGGCQQRGWCAVAVPPATGTSRCRHHPARVAGVALKGPGANSRAPWRAQPLRQPSPESGAEVMPDGGEMQRVRHRRGQPVSLPFAQEPGPVPGLLYPAGRAQLRVVVDVQCKRPEGMGVVGSGIGDAGARAARGHPRRGTLWKSLGIADGVGGKRSAASGASV